jgi:hypothetical protein
LSDLCEVRLIGAIDEPATDTISLLLEGAVIRVAKAFREHFLLITEFLPVKKPIGTAARTAFISPIVHLLYPHVFGIT